MREKNFFTIDHLKERNTVLKLTPWIICVFPLSVDCPPCWDLLPANSCYFNFAWNIKSHQNQHGFQSTPAATAEVAISRHIPVVSPGAENAIGFVDSTYLKEMWIFNGKQLVCKVFLRQNGVPKILYFDIIFEICWNWSMNSLHSMCLDLKVFNRRISPSGHGS